MLIRRLLSGVVLLLLRLGLMPTLDGVGAQEGMAMLHRGASSHQLTLVSSDGGQEQLALTDEDVLYLGITVDESECQPVYSTSLCITIQQHHLVRALPGSRNAYECKKHVQ